MSEERTWHEDDAFWHTFAPWMFHPERWQRAPDEVDGLIAVLGLGAGAAVLDLCCGPGRHSVELARRDCRVTGMDRTQEFLQKARELAERLVVIGTKPDAK